MSRRRPGRDPGRRLSTFFFRHSRLRLGALLAAPLGWMVVIYLGSLVLLLLASFWSVGGVLGTEIVHSWNLDNYRTLVEEPVYRDVAFRTISMAALVTIADAVLAFPIAYYMARVASPRTRNLLVVAVLTPLWASYLVKAYSWRDHSRRGRGPQLAARTVRALWPGLHVDRSLAGVHVPLAAVHDPPDLRRPRADPVARCSRRRRISAGKSLRTFWKVTLPLTFPAIVAGSIFTFSLTLGDYILPGLIRTSSSSERSSTRTGQQPPLAAAFAMVPVVVMTVYLWGAKRLGAFESL